MFTNCSFLANYRRGRETPHTLLGDGGVGFRGVVRQWYVYNVCLIHNEIAVEKAEFLCHRGVC